MEVAVKVRYASRGIPGVPKEEVFPWDEDCGGVVRFDEGAIRLSGKRRVGVIGDVLTFGLAQPLLKRAVAKSLEVEIPVGQLERVTFLRSRSPLGIDLLRYRIFQRLPDGSESVHVFVVGLAMPKNGPTLDDVVAGVRAVVPAAILADEAARAAAGQAAPAQVLPPAEWCADPTGRHQLRYWNGTVWTDSVADDGKSSVDPVQGHAAPKAEPAARTSPAPDVCKAFKAGRCVVQEKDTGPCDWEPSDWRHCGVVIENQKYGSW